MYVRWLVNILLAFGLFYSCATNSPQRLPASAAGEGENISCIRKTVRQVYTPQITKKYIKISQDRFNELNQNLYKTLSGNLATVFRSEWKSKSSYKETAKLIKKLIASFGVEDLPFSHLKPGKEYVFAFEKYLKEHGSIGPIRLRDPPPPAGSFDRTLTYYTKQLLGSEAGKHQIRDRTYIRTIIPEQMQQGIPVMGYLDNRLYRLEKLKHGQFQVTMLEKSKLTGQLVEAERLKYSTRRLKREFGDPIYWLAYPHAKKMKLEIKTILTRSIKLARQKKLRGKHLVQKLSINHKVDDIELLFNNDEVLTPDDIRPLIKHFVYARGNNNDRTRAVLGVLQEGINHDEDYLDFVGATEYRRIALAILIPDKVTGKPVEIQMTFDYDMKVNDVYDDDNELVDPISVIRQGKFIIPKKIQYDVHEELKVPLSYIEKAEKDESSIPPTLLHILNIFNEQNVNNVGKFEAPNP